MEVVEGRRVGERGEDGWGRGGGEDRGGEREDGGGHRGSGRQQGE